VSFQFESDHNTPHVTDAGRFASDGEMELLGLIEVDGKPGRRGQDGTSYRNPPYSPGATGSRGGDAGPATPGQNAGAVDCELTHRVDCELTHSSVRSSQVRDQIRWTTRAQLPDGRIVPMEQNVPIGDRGFLFIDGHGGDGGNGGRAGNGGPGSQGYAGRNATRFTSGTNGGPGGDGGDAGQPSDGRNGGDGANVNLIVDHTETGLLMLVKGNLVGGDLGFAGEAGRGGQGGPGGPGGRSYHWTETRTSRDSNGRTVTRTIMRSNPGGINGRPGRTGRPSLYNAKDAKPGKTGQLTIRVRDASGQLVTYKSPFDLELVTFDIASEYTILEPDSIVSLDHIVIRNCGGMPTPANYTVRVFLAPDKWLISDEVDVVLHRSLAPGETYTFCDDGLDFRIGDYVVDEPRTRSFRLRHPVSPQARLESGIARSFEQFENGEDIRVRFPVELTPITCLNSLAPGESTRVIWSVKNIGAETFDQKYLYRSVRSRLRLLGGDLHQNLIAFFDDEDSSFAIQSVDGQSTDWEKRVGELRPGESTIIETRIGIRDQPGAVAYQGFAVGVDLDLQRPGTSDRSDQYRRVDYRKTFIRVSERYLREEGSRFLLVANEKTTTNDIEKWTQLADYFGSELDVWDVSYYGFLDLVRAVDEDQSLLKQWEGMTMIIPNNYYSTPAGRTVAFEQLAKGQFIRAAADYDINFYIVGDSRTGGAEMLATSLIPVGDEKTPNQLESQKEFLKRVKRWNKYVAGNQRVVGGVTSNAQDIADASLGHVHEIDIDRRTFLFQPKEKWLIEEAKRLQRKLSKQDPLKRWIIVHRYDTGDTDTSWGFFRKRNVGKFELRRTLDSTKGSVVLFEVEGIDAIDRGFINSQANKHGIFLALKFEDKIDRFIRLVSERTFPRYSENYIERPMTDEEVQEIGGELVDSILTDLYNEQKTARECRTWGRGGVRAIMPKLNYLAERSLNYGVTHRQMLENELSLGLLYELLANLRYMAVQSRTIWDHAIFPTAFFKRSRAVSNYMIERSDRIATNIFGRAPSWWDKITSPGDDYDPFGSSKKKSPQGIERDTADARIKKIETELIQKTVSVETYAGSQNHSGLTYDPELLTESVRVISGEQYDALVQAERQATRRRYETEKAIQGERADLLVPMKTVTAQAETVQQSIATPS
jgi:hypothetical protein